MKLNFKILLFLFCMVMGVTISMCTNNWISIWLGMELSMMSFVPMMSEKSKKSSESSIKYFIIQSLSSTIMMMGVIMMCLNLSFKMLVYMSLMMKLGMFPFHTWMISMIESLLKLPLISFLTLMKMSPMNMMSYLNQETQLLLMSGMLMSSISGMIQNSIKKIIGYSSIFNMSIIMSCIENYTAWMSYFMGYSIMLIMLIMILNTNNTKYINQMMINSKKMQKLSLWIIMISMSGFPPSMGFLIKIIAMKHLMMQNQYIMTSTMIMSSMLIMFFYMRLSLTPCMMYLSMNKWIILKKSAKINSWTIVLTMMLMPMMTTAKMLT